RLLKRAISITENAKGANHPDVAWTLTNLALLYWRQGRYGDAEALHKRALTIREQVLGESHPPLPTTTAWPSFMRRNVSTGRRRGCTSAHWRSRKKRLVRTIPPWAGLSATWPSCIETRGSTWRRKRSSGPRWSSGSRPSARAIPSWPLLSSRSEERRVGKECRCRGSA